MCGVHPRPTTLLKATSKKFNKSKKKAVIKPYNGLLILLCGTRSRNKKKKELAFATASNNPPIMAYRLAKNRYGQKRG